MRTALLGLDDLAILVVATVRAHAMRQLDLAALRAHAARGCIDTIMSGPAGMGADTAHSLFRYCHLNISLVGKHAKRYGSKASAAMQ